MLIPLNGERPLIKGWTKLGVPDESKVRDWWRKHPSANLGIVCGKTSGIFILDVDVKTGGIENLDLLESEYGSLPDTLIAQTGGGGRHYFFKFPSGGLGNSTGQLPSGLDIRGEGGQVAVHPSVHESGRTYEWQDFEPGEIEIAEAPAWLLDLIRDKASSSRNGSVDNDGPIPESTRNITLTSLAGKLRYNGFSSGEICAALSEANRRRCDNPLPETEVRRIADSVGRYEPGVSLTPIEPTPPQRKLPEPSEFPIQALGEILGEAAKRMKESIQAPLAIWTRPNPGKSSLKTFFGNAAISVKLTILLICEISISTKEVLAFSNSLIKWQIFQSMNRILRDHSPHGPKLSNQLTGVHYDLPNLITIFSGKGLR